MHCDSQYELIDFGEERKLERFSDIVLDRPSPAAEAVAKTNVAVWEKANARYVRIKSDCGEWKGADSLPETWHMDYGGLRFELKATPFGHVGVFPEQFDNWAWIRQHIEKMKVPPTVLNLFAYTGGSTLAAAAAGANVVHVDAAKNVTNWARRNAGLSGLGDAPIRWIVDDVRKFVRREVRRGNRYDAVILDPPAYGHGAKGERWSIQDHLGELLDECVKLTGDNLQMVLLTCHSEGFGITELSQLVSELVPTNRRRSISSGTLDLVSNDGRKLNSGVFVRWAHEH